MRAMIVTPYAGDGDATAYHPKLADDFALDSWFDATAGRWIPARNHYCLDAQMSGAVLTAILADATYLVIWSTAGTTVPTTTPDATARSSLSSGLQGLGYSAGEATAAVGTGQFTHAQVGANVAALERVDPPQGVPRSSDWIDWTVDVETWWATHWMNPLSASYVATITSPATTVDVDGAHGGDLQAAIDALPADGGTLLLGAGSSYGRVQVVAKSHVHFIGGAGTKVRGVQLWGDAQCQSYTNWFTALRVNDAAALAVARDRPRDFYFKNVIFDGQGDACTVSDNTPSGIALMCRGVRDILLDGCTIQNYANQSPLTFHPGVVSGNGLVDGLWARGCAFNASVNEAWFCDGLHDGGCVGCTFNSNTVSHYVLHLCNNDYTLDLDGDGVVGPWETRLTSHVAYVGNTFTRTTSPGSLELLSMTSAKALVKGNTVLGSGADGRIFVQLQTRVWNPFGLPSGGHFAYGSVVDSNVLGHPLYGTKVDGASGISGIGPGASAGRIGHTTVKNNTAQSITAWALDVPTVDGATVVSGNTP